MAILILPKINSPAWALIQMWSQSLNLYLSKTEDGYKVEEPEKLIPRPELAVPESKPNFQVVFSEKIPLQTAPASFRIPVCSKWFQVDSVHLIEKQSLPEYFSGEFPSKTPCTYIYQRNYIVHKYRENPKKYLSATTCRRELPGDASGILKIHCFLEKWGLINFQAEPSSRPVPYHQLRLPPADYIEIEETEVFCGYCGKPCPELWYSHHKLDLCAKCFGTGNFPMLLCPEDFKKHSAEVKTSYIPNFVSEELVAAVQKHGSNWEKVAEELEKPLSEVIWEFLRLPVNEVGDMKLGLNSKLTYKNFCTWENPMLDQLKNTVEDLEDLMPVEAPDTPKVDLEELSLKINNYKQKLSQIKQTQDLLDQEEAKLQESQDEFLFLRIHRSVTKGLYLPKKCLLIK